NAFDLVLFDAGRQGRTRQAHDSDRGDVDLRNCRLPIDRQPDLARMLSAERVKSEGCQEADDAPGYALRDFREAVVLAWFGPSRCVQSATQAAEMPLADKPTDLLGVQAERLGL